MEKEKLFINLPIEYYNDTVKKIHDQENEISDLKSKIKRLESGNNVGVPQLFNGCGEPFETKANADRVEQLKPTTTDNVTSDEDKRNDIVPWWLDGVI